MHGGYMDYRDGVMTVGAWMKMLLLLMIPVVNVVMIFVWALGGGVNKNQQNLVRAQILFSVILTVLFVLVTIVVYAVGFIAYQASGG